MHGGFGGCISSMIWVGKMSNSDVFDNGNAAVHDFASIAAYVNRKPQPEPKIKIVTIDYAKPGADSAVIVKNLASWTWNETPLMRRLKVKGMIPNT